MAGVKGRDLSVMLGEPKKAILALAVPMLFSYLIADINLFVDTFWTSGLGDRASSAISTITPLYSIITALGIGLSVAASATISYRLGKGDLESASRIAGNIVLLGIIMSLVISPTVLVLMDPIIDFMGAGDVRDLGRDYMVPLLLMSWAIILNNVVAGLLRSEGGGRKSMIVLSASACFNMVLDPLLIYVLDMGIAGASLATGLSALVATLVGFYWYHAGKMNVRLGRDSFRFSRSYAKEALDVAIPRSTESLINSFMIIVQRVFIIAVAGTIGVMYFNMPWRFIMLAIVPAQAIGSAMIPVCSAALGQGDPQKMLVGMRYSLRIVLIVSVVIAAIVFLGSDLLISVYTYSDSMHQHKEMLSWVLRTDAIAIVPYALTTLGGSMLQAMKKSKTSMYVMFIWAFIKLGLFYIATFFDFHAIIYALVLSHFIVLGLMSFFVVREVRRRVGGDGAIGAVAS